MKVAHNKNNKWQEELRLLGLENLIPFVESVVKEALEKQREEIKENMRQTLVKYPSLHLRTYFDDFNRLHETKNDNNLIPQKDAK